MKTARAFVICALLFPCAATAQVSVDPAALQQLAGIVPAPVAVPEARPAPAPVRHRKTYRHPAMAAAKAPDAVKPVPVVARPAEPPAPVPAAPKPAGPVTIAFAPGSADLPPGAAASLGQFCGAGGMVGIDARAPADKTDPSAAMRLSLARALAVKAALSACGVAGQDILPRAQGAMPGANEDETIVGMAK